MLIGEASLLHLFASALRFGGCVQRQLENENLVFDVDVLEGDIKGMLNHMGRMMASLPESAPPKLIASILPKLQEQNEQIIGMLREQNDLLRDQRQKTAA